jgi:formate hydrogenlyase subunit 3/multisubunit Na+/H+ antiporter MnhD subunit
LEEVPTMQNNQGYIESGGFFQNIISFVLTPIAALFLYIILFVLTAIAVYFMKKNDQEVFVSHHGRGNLIYLNSAAKQFHDNRRRMRKLP